MKRIFLFFSAITLLATTSCTKEKNEATSVTKENVSGTYTVTKIEAKSSSSREDITNMYFETVAEPCDRDNTTTFKTDGTWVEDDATVKCDPSVTLEGTWSVKDGSTLIIEGETVAVESFDGKVLKVIHDYSSSGQQAQFIVTMTKQ